MKFEWDPKKAEIKLRKHGVSFEEATPALIFDDNEHSQAEHREIIIGTSALTRIVLVCFVERMEDTIRIFSDRRATKNELKDDEENARNQIP